MILLIDNYDSFSYNLYQLVGAMEPDLRVIRNDAFTVAEIDAMKPDGIILSPGPGRPADAGVIIDVVRELGAKYPILGVCLGHQAICEALGGTVSYAKELMHGKQSVATLDVKHPLFQNCPTEALVARYHSLAVVPETLPACLAVIGKTADGEIMAVAHKEYDVYGVQFHPESIMTPDGATMLHNFIQRTRETRRKEGTLK